jgi:hypothetical protein
MAVEALIAIDGLYHAQADCLEEAGDFGEICSAANAAAFLNQVIPSQNSEESRYICQVYGVAMSGINWKKLL